MLDSGGNLWLDVGGYRTVEFSGYRALMFNKTWQIQGLSRSTPVNLTVSWTTEGFIVWDVLINGATYQPPNNSFNMRLYEPTAIEKFYVGWENIFPMNGPYYVCYYFQFGITSPNYIWQGGWNALIEYPQWYKDGGWHRVQQAQTTQGPYAYLDSAFMWGGTTYLLDNNLLPASESSGGTDVMDYYMIQQMLSQRENGTYSLMFSEFENEHNFFDRVQLVAVDHHSNVNVALSPYDEILTYTDPSPPVSAMDDNNRNVKSLLGSIDGNYYESRNGSYITLNFGDLDVSQGAKLVLRADYAKKSIHVQVQDLDSNWITVATVIPRINWATEIIDMSEYLPDVKGNLKVRLYFTANHKLDFVGLDTSPQATIHVQEGQLVSAAHSTEGDVTNKLFYSDGMYAELVPGQSIELIFTLPQQTMEERNYIIITEGHYHTTP